MERSQLLVTRKKPTEKRKLRQEKEDRFTHVDNFYARGARLPQGLQTTFRVARKVYRRPNAPQEAKISYYACGLFRKKR